MPNPATELARLVAALHDADGRVQIPGFYDDVVELTDVERDLFAKVPDDDDEFLAVAKSRALHGEAGFSTLERLGARPTAEVNGIGGGYQGDGNKTIIPSDAFVKLSFRLVADQDPVRIQQQVDAFVAANTPDGIVAAVEWEGEGVRAVPGPDRHACLRRADRGDQRGLRRPAGAADPRGRQRAGGGAAAGDRRAAGVPRRRPARRPDPRAEREGHPLDALQGRRGGRRCCGPGSPRWDGPHCALTSAA